MGNPKFNSKMLKYFFDSSNDVKRFIHSRYMEAQLDYYDFFSIFLNQYGIAIGIVANIQDNTYRAYINYAQENILNMPTGEINLIEGVSSDEANIVLAEKLINIFENTNYDDWTNLNNKM
ncbi:hypothetical protein [Chryseobacterium sp. IT-36CA2]|uniref:hypothetical protein n=1 Tax=Chryseobacterium sp. IT-36CA2 TaxID=3026460 RepID=UPI0039E11729